MLFQTLSHRNITKAWISEPCVPICQQAIQLTYCYRETPVQCDWRKRKSHVLKWQPLSCWQCWESNLSHARHGDSLFPLLALFQPSLSHFLIFFTAPGSCFFPFIPSIVEVYLLGKRERPFSLSIKCLFLSEKRWWKRSGLNSQNLLKQILLI